MPAAKEAVKKLIVTCIRRYGIDVVAMPHLNAQQKYSDAVVSLVSYVKDTSKRQDIELRNCDLVEARRRGCTDEKPTRANAASHLAERYKELGRYLATKKEWQRRYYRCVFDAITVAEACNGENATPKAVAPVQEYSKVIKNVGSTK
jgi:hypothetical protein